MTRANIVRLILIALAFTSVNASLSARPAPILDFWYLYYCPVIISAISFGLRGALLGSAAAVIATTILLDRVQGLVQLAGQDVLLRFALFPHSSGLGTGQILSTLASALGASNATTNAVNLDFSGDFSFAVAEVGLGNLAIIAIACIVGWQTDLQQKHERTIELQARTDGLTGLANHRTFIETLTEKMTDGVSFGLLLIDMDHLKEINDRYGHLVGDQALQHTATLLSQVTRSDDIVARQGGDEFGVLLLDTPSANEDTAMDHAQKVAQRLLDAAAATPMILPDSEKLVIRLSIGVAAYPTHGDRPEKLVSKADSALYTAKHAGGQRSALVLAG